MLYFVAFQVLCGCFSAHVAGRKGRNALAWWFVGALVPAFGVVLSLVVPEETASTPGPGEGPSPQAAQPARRRPKRCRGSYVPDCLGCPYFRRRLFGPAHGSDRKGYCDFLGKDLVAHAKENGSQVKVEDA